VARLRKIIFSPTAVVLLIGIALTAIMIALNGGNPLALAHLGTRFSQGDPQGTSGYDGQFVYYIAVEPRPSQVAARLDAPAYRYQRILLPLLARLLAFGQPALVPWTIPLINLLALAGGTWVLSVWLAQHQFSRWYALTYGLWAGFTLSLVADMAEPLAYALAAGGFLALEGLLSTWRSRLGWLLLGLAVFARETTLLFAVALPLAYVARRSWRAAIESALIMLLPFAVFQGWLWVVFGRPGIGSGGANATPFEIIPFMGLLRIGRESMAYLLGMGFVFGLTVILPALWGVWVSGRAWLKGGRSALVIALFLNAAVIAFTPYSTFRETGGMIRFATGLVLSILLFAAKYGFRRVLNYSVFWLVLNVFLLK
jgi:hypothetical protein